MFVVKQLLSRSVRGKIRESKGIEGSGVIDFLLHWFCGCCAIAQEGREVQGGGQSMARE
jgi:Cys-rich protein (TIGR01571 family)